MTSLKEIEEKGEDFDMDEFFEGLTDDELIAWHKEAARKLTEDPGLAAEMNLPQEVVDHIMTGHLDFERSVLAERAALKAEAESKATLLKRAEEYLRAIDKVERPEIYNPETKPTSSKPKGH